MYNVKFYNYPLAMVVKFLKTPCYRKRELGVNAAAANIHQTLTKLPTQLHT
jgi:hypothetical protein